MYMNIFALSGFINGLSAIIFGFFVFHKNPKKLSHKTFLLMNVALVFWGVSYGFWQLSLNKETALFWAKCLSIGSTFIPITFLHWIFTIYDLHKKRRAVIISGYLLTAILFLFSFSPLFVKNVKPQLNFPWWPIAGPVYTIYLFGAYGAIIAYACYELLKIYKKSSNDIRNQIKYIFLAIIIGFGGGATNFPLWYGISFPPYGNFFVAFYPLILSYAIVKHRLFDIKVVIAALIVGIISIVLFFNIFDAVDLWQYMWKGFVFFVFLIFGVLLIRSVLREIKQREEMEEMAEKLKIAYEKLSELDKAKTEFISIASHQLKTPLSIVRGYLSMVLEETYGEVSREIKKPIKNSFQVVSQLNKLVQDLLDISRIEAGKMEMNIEKTSLEDLIGEVVEQLKIAAHQKDLYLRYKKNIPLPLMSLDKEKIRQVFINIIDNAIKYTEKGGIKIISTVKENRALIKISDTGLGMSEEEATNLFQSFRRGEAGERSWTGGAGLGLYIARKFTELHKGIVWATPKKTEKGSLFYINIPLS